MSKPTILIIDDEPLNLAVLSRLLNPHYRVLGARSGASALTLLAAAVELPDLILLDIMMPEMDGYAVLAQLRQDPRSHAIPVIFVTALGTEVNEEYGLGLGAVDYIVKPIKPAIVLARVRTQLELKTARDRLASQNHWLEAELARRMREVLVAQDLTISMMADLAETRDSDTGNHVRRTQAYVEALARHLQADPAYTAELDEIQLQRIVKAAPLHDIGKIGIPDHILLKPGRLTPEEFTVMKQHTSIGGTAISHAIQQSLDLHAVPGLDDTPESVRFLEVARDIATHHHERWDGHGYPAGLAGVQIPLSARLMAVADIFDALTMKRVYKRSWSIQEAITHIHEQAGTHLDPGVVAAFMSIKEQCAAIAERLAD